MNLVQADIDELRRQLGQGSIQKAYRAILSFMQRLRASYTGRHGEAAVSALYQGYLDMTYFAIFPDALKPRGLKVAVVFNYEAFRFEAWLVARNRKVQREYWELFKKGQWADYRLVEPAVGVDAILSYDLAREFDLDNPQALTAKIEDGVDTFIVDVEHFLSCAAEQAHPAGGRGR